MTVIVTGGYSSASGAAAACIDGVRDNKASGALIGAEKVTKKECAIAPLT
jgi:hypothetical protein